MYQRSAAYWGTSHSMDNVVAFEVGEAVRTVEVVFERAWRDGLVGKHKGLQWCQKVVAVNGVGF